MKKIFLWLLIISLLSGCSVDWNNNNDEIIKKECIWNNEWLNDSWVCLCNDGYERKNEICSIKHRNISLEESILKIIPSDSFLREYKLIPENQGVYIGIYIKNYEIEKPLNSTGSIFLSCPEMAQWQWIKWEYHIFSYVNREITSDLIVPSIDNRYFKDSELVLSYMNTKNNNYWYLWWEKPKSESEDDIIEKSNLINFNDYNWDGIKWEFLLVNWQENDCWGKNYLIAWYDQVDKKAIIYGIKGKERNVSYWNENFIPNDKWEVYHLNDQTVNYLQTNKWSFSDELKCMEDTWDMDDVYEMTIEKNLFQFSKEDNLYSLTKTQTKFCQSIATNQNIIKSNLSTLWDSFAVPAQKAKTLQQLIDSSYTDDWTDISDDQDIEWDMLTVPVPVTKKYTPIIDTSGYWVNPDQIYVDPYIKSDWTYVSGHNRTKPNSTKSDNIWCLFWSLCN